MPTFLPLSFCAVGRLALAAPTPVGPPLGEPAELRPSSPAALLGQNGPPLLATRLTQGWLWLTNRHVHQPAEPVVNGPGLDGGLPPGSGFRLPGTPCVRFYLRYQPA